MWHMLLRVHKSCLKIPRCSITCLPPHNANYSRSLQAYRSLLVFTLNQNHVREIGHMFCLVFEYEWLGYGHIYNVKYSSQKEVSLTLIEWWFCLLFLCLCKHIMSLYHFVLFMVPSWRTLHYVCVLISSHERFTAVRLRCNVFDS